MPLFVSWPGKILPNTKVEEKVSHLDVSCPVACFVGLRLILMTHVAPISSLVQLFSTILDYAEAGEYDKSDGSSLRPFIERHETNVDFDEDVVFAEWYVCRMEIALDM